MAIKIEIYLPEETTEMMDDTEGLILGIGDLVSVNYGNTKIDEFNLESLKSFIIIRDEEIPPAENFVDTDAFLLIPMESENDD